MRDQVWTPPLNTGCLPGITREVILHEIHTPGISVGEKTLFPVDLESADEVFITSTTRDLLTVSHIEAKPVGRTDHARHALANGFAEYLRNYIAAHARQPATRGDPADSGREVGQQDGRIIVAMIG